MSSEEERDRWDLKYEQGLPSLAEPDPFFVSAYDEFVHPSFANAGVALDLAGGLGRHALWLAQRRWQVSVVDVSEVAIQKLGAAAFQQTVELDLLAADASNYKFEAERFDLIVLFYHLDRNLFPKIVSALKPGGLLVCKMSLRWIAGGDSSREGKAPLERNELPSFVPELHVLHYQERPARDHGVAEFVGSKARK